MTKSKKIKNTEEQEIEPKKKQKTRSKFNVDKSEKGIEKRTHDNILFDSEIEMKFYRDYLLPRKNEGKIKNIEIHPKYILQENYTLRIEYKKFGRTLKINNIVYEADFEVLYDNDSVEIFDVKGVETPDAKIKRKLFDYLYPDKILRWVNKSDIDGGWVDVEIIKKGRRERRKNNPKKEMKKKSK